MIKPITIQQYNDATDSWTPLSYNGLPIVFHAKVNKSGGSEYLGSGADQSETQKIFRIRYSTIIKDIELNTQLYRIIYDGVIYSITDYDDYNDLHHDVKLYGEARGVANE